MESDTNMESRKKSSFNGISVSFTELEILRQIQKGINTVNEIYENLAISYSVFKYSQSQFYRIINAMVEDKYITAEKIGKIKILEIATKGRTELANLEKYLYILLQDLLVTTDIWKDLLALFSEQAGCLRDKKVYIIGPGIQPATTLMESCKYCTHPVLVDENPIYKPTFLAFPDANVEVYNQGKHNVNILDIIDPNDLRIKTADADVVIVSGTLHVFDRDAILHEVSRMLKPEGYAIFLEHTKQTPRMIFMIYNRMMESLSQATAKRWMLNEELLSKDELRAKIAEYLTINFETVQTIMNVIIAQKH